MSDICFLTREISIITFRFFFLFSFKNFHMQLRREAMQRHIDDLTINSSYSSIIACCYHFFFSDIAACKHICLMIYIRYVEVYLKSWVIYLIWIPFNIWFKVIINGLYRRPSYSFPKIPLIMWFSNKGSYKTLYFHDSILFSKCCCQSFN